MGAVRVPRGVLGSGLGGGEGPHLVAPHRPARQEAVRTGGARPQVDDEGRGVAGRKGPQRQPRRTEEVQCEEEIQGGRQCGYLGKQGHVSGNQLQRGFGVIQLNLRVYQLESYYLWSHSPVSPFVEGGVGFYLIIWISLGVVETEARVFDILRLHES